MTTLAAVIGAAAFLAGLVSSFAGNRLQGRLRGLGAMAVGALLVLISADPTSAATWWMAATGALTLAGLLAFGTALGRWTAREVGDGSSVLDDDPA